MEVIDERKKLELLKEDVLRKEQARQKYSSGYYRLSLVSVEENIGLWKKRYFNDDKESLIFIIVEQSCLLMSKIYHYAFILSMPSHYFYIKSALSTKIHVYFCAFLTTNF